MPGVCLCHKEIDRFPSSSTAPKSEILGDKQQPHLETVLPPKQKSVAKNRDEFIGTTRDDIQRDYLASSAGVQATSDDSVQRRRAEKHIDIPTKADFMAQTTQERDLANYKMGLMAVSTSEYLQKETGLLSVLERAFGGAFTYSSPQEMSQNLGPVGCITNRLLIS